jgi:hypothetical protein
MPGALLPTSPAFTHSAYGGGVLLKLIASLDQFVGVVAHSKDTNLARAILAGARIPRQGKLSSVAKLLLFNRF